MEEQVIKLRKGFDVNLFGKPETKLSKFSASTFAIKPPDFQGIKPIPKLVVEQGSEVKAGDPLFFDKPNPEIFYTAPVSGEVIAIRRGDKRSIAEIVILADNKISYKDFGKADPADSSRDKILNKLLESGLWPMLRQRPFNVLADPALTPKGIFISAFDTSPLSPDYNFIINGNEKEFQAGIDTLDKLCEGNVHLSLNGADKKIPEAFIKVERAQLHYFKGKHPAGNVGVQIHHIDPINKGEVVWTVNVQDVLNIGSLFLNGQVNMERTICIGGPDVIDPKYYKTILGANIEEMVKNNVAKNMDLRFISGNVLTGTQIEANGHLGYYDHQLTVIEEGNKSEFIGWLIPSYARPSMSRSFLTGWLAAIGFPEEYRANTNTHGEDRAFVMSGQYEQVVPMDIYPVHLLKSIMYEDIDQMEGLGIYEVVEEDFALCEFVCTSKTDVQEILREGLDLMNEQT